MNRRHRSIVSCVFATLAFCLGACQTGAQTPAYNQRWRQAPTGNDVRNITVDGRQRSYEIFISKDVDRSRPAPLILAFHGGASNPDQFARVTKLNERAGPRGYIIVYPAGYKNFWHSGDDCCGPPLDEGINDTAFVRAVLDQVEKEYKVDPERVYAAGFSNGGKMTYRVACEMSERIAAIAVNGSSLGIAKCEPTHPISIIHFHGTADTFHPYKGGRGTATEFQMPQDGAPQTIARWARMDGCSDETETTLKKGKTTCVTHGHCEGGTALTLCTVEGMGHQWPGGTVRFPPQLAQKLGPGSDDISATDMLLEFFKKHPLVKPAGANAEKKSTPGLKPGDESRRP